jgi:excinuclease ABC subunit C
MRDRTSELLEVSGVGVQTRTRLVQHFGSVRAVKEASMEALRAVVPERTAKSIYAQFHADEAVAEKPAFPILAQDV